MVILVKKGTVIVDCSCFYCNECYHDSMSCNLTENTCMSCNSLFIKGYKLTSKKQVALIIEESYNPLEVFRLALFAIKLQDLLKPKIIQELDLKFSMAQQDEKLLKKTEIAFQQKAQRNQLNLNKQQADALQSSQSLNISNMMNQSFSSQNRLMDSKEIIEPTPLFNLSPQESDVNNKINKKKKRNKQDGKGRNLQVAKNREGNLPDSVDSANQTNVKEQSLIDVAINQAKELKQQSSRKPLKDLTNSERMSIQENISTTSKSQCDYYLQKDALSEPSQQQILQRQVNFEEQKQEKQILNNNEIKSQIQFEPKVQSQIYAEEVKEDMISRKSQNSKRKSKKPLDNSFIEQQQQKTEINKVSNQNMTENKDLYQNDQIMVQQKSSKPKTSSRPKISSFISHRRSLLQVETTPSKIQSQTSPPQQIMQNTDQNKPLKRLKQFDKILESTEKKVYRRSEYFAKRYGNRVSTSSATSQQQQETPKRNQSNQNSDKINAKKSSTTAKVQESSNQK
eukprot:403347408